MLVFSFNKAKYKQKLTAIPLDWDEKSICDETTQGKAIADACIATGVTQLIWSSLPHISKITEGKAGMRNFDGKAEVEKYIRTLDIKSMFFMPGWFMQNQVRVMKPSLVSRTFLLY